MRIFSRALIGILLVLVPVGVSAPSAADDYVSTVDEIADALRDQPVLVHETVGGGDTAGATKRLSGLAEKLPFDAYVAVVNTPPDIAQKADDPSDYLLQALHTRIDRPGVYVVQTSGGTLAVEAWGIDVDDTTLSLMVSDNTQLVYERLRELHGEGYDEGVAPPVAAGIALRTAGDPAPESGSTYATFSSDVVDEIAQLPGAYQAEADVVDLAESRTGFTWMVVTACAVLVLLAVQQTLRRAWPGWRRGPKPEESGPPPIDIESVRTRAGRAMTSLSTNLSRAPADVAHPEYVQQAMLASNAAEHMHDSDNLVDVVGALVLARTGSRDVERAATAEPSEPYRCCYFNPLHGESATRVGWRYGDATLQIPVCDDCARASETGSVPDRLTVPDGRRQRPYYERNDVWARTGFGSLTDEFGDIVLETLR